MKLYALRVLACCLIVFWAAAPAQAQSPVADVQRTPVYTTYAAFEEALSTLAATADEAARSQRLAAWWATLEAAHQVPFAVGDSVAFLYRGDAHRVAWHGDFDSWGRDSTVASAGRRVAGTDLWVLEHVFPADARIDYKVVVDGRDWKLDPANPLQVWSGFGPNSELRMPAYVFPRVSVRRDDVAGGALGTEVPFESAALGYAVHYRVYTPAGYDARAALPVLYVTDGHEFAADHLGGMVAVLDNLMHEGRLSPLVVVFIDPRDPADPARNRRHQEYIANPAFLTFVADELVPHIDGMYRTNPAPSARGILGTSLGGLCAAYFGAMRPDVFQKIGIFSPAFWAHRAVYDQYRTLEDPGLRIFLSQGTINDGQGGREMRAILAARGFDLAYLERNEGHSWGHWRGILDDFLLYAWGR